MKTIILATNNTHKQKEFQSLLSNFKILTLKDINFLEDVEETGVTTKENAEIKARAIFDFEKSKGLNFPVISDDSGLFVNALGGEPGVYSARYAGDHNSQSNRDKMIKNLEGKNDRSAYFECTICYIDENTTKFLLEEHMDKSRKRKLVTQVLATTASFSPMIYTKLLDNLLKKKKTLSPTEVEL